MMARILSMLRPHWRSISMGFLCLVLATPAQAFHPLVWMYIVDEVITGGRHGMLLPALAVMLLVHLVGAALSTGRDYLLGVAGQRFVGDLRNRLHEKLMAQSLGYFHDRRSGDLTARVINDVDSLQDVVINGVDSIFSNFLSLFVVAGIIIWLNWEVGILTLVPLALVACIVYVFNQRVKGLYRRIRDRLGDLQAHLQEHLLGIMVIKAFARESQEYASFRRHNDEYVRAGIRGVVVRSAYFPSVMAVGFLSNVIMIGAGAWFVILGKFTVGGLVAYRGYWWQLFSPVFTLAQINEMLQRARASASRIFEVLDEPCAIEDAPDAEDVADTGGNIQFDHVSFGYDPGRTVLRDISFEVRTGQRIGVVGPSGAGKSTVLRLILRLFDVTGGHVSIDGRDIRSLRQTGLRRHMAVVTQEPFLFNQSIAANIRFARLDATPEEVEEAARLANAHEFIARLPEGYDTLIGERGVKLSGGQKQRLCIARAFLENPRILLLDEATAAVEPESEALIQAAIERLEQGRTTVIVSHRLSLVRDCDAILVIDEGRIAERGTHEELLGRQGWYARMHALQMEGVRL